MKKKSLNGEVDDPAVKRVVGVAGAAFGSGDRNPVCTSGVGGLETVPPPPGIRRSGLVVRTTTASDPELGSESDAEGALAPASVVDEGVDLVLLVTNQRVRVTVPSTDLRAPIGRERLPLAHLPGERCRRSRSVGRGGRPGGRRRRRHRREGRGWRDWRRRGRDLSGRPGGRPRRRNGPRRARGRVRRRRRDRGAGRCRWNRGYGRRRGERCSRDLSPGRRYGRGRCESVGRRGRDHSRRCRRHLRSRRRNGCVSRCARHVAARTRCGVCGLSRTVRTARQETQDYYDQCEGLEAMPHGLGPPFLLLESFFFFCCRNSRPKARRWTLFRFYPIIY